MGKGRESGPLGEGSIEKANAHRSTPLQSLTDPASFGPPPKSPGFQAGTVALKNRQAGAAPSQLAITARPQTSSPLSAQPTYASAQVRAAEVAKPAPPPIPFRANTTGIDTSNMPKPPPRPIQPVVEVAGPSAARPIVATRAAVPVVKPKPQPPPRLPPRQNSNPDEFAPEPPPVYTPVSTESQAGQLNQAALGRLGTAGVSVPGFNIGRQPSTQAASTTSPPSTSASQLGELQSRFSRMSKPSAPSPATSTPTAPATTATGGTTWAQKQAALRTASNFQQDPSSVSFSDMRTAASTANNFHARHGEQVKAGYAGASAMNQKYGIANKMGNAASTMGGMASKYSGQETGVVGAEGAVSPPAAPPSPFARPSAPTPSTAAAGPAVAKKAPPPPPKRKGIPVGEEAEEPPALPLSSKPR